MEGRLVTEDRANAKITAFYDGKCPMCTALMDAVGRSSKKDEFDLRDMQVEKSLPFRKEAVEKEIHVVDQGGRTYKGAQAILKILEQYPRFKALAAIGQ